jgi:hypothetical protein
MLISVDLQPPHGYNPFQREQSIYLEYDLHPALARLDTSVEGVFELDSTRLTNPVRRGTKTFREQNRIRRK